ncbi:MAG: tRNA epoxyqueuosine(34) reductase QueG [Dethiobacteria bacterium]|nr:tRNA epoxyqueuosine(34) reductase QueG [Bacillota bacterium]
MEKRLKEYAHEQGLGLLGITSAENFEAYKLILESRIATGRQSPFEEKDLLRRLSPKSLLPGAKSIISLAVPYSGGPQEPADGEGVLRGYISLFARGHDYHRVLKERLALIVRFLKQESGTDFNYLTFVDNGPPLERAIAVRAGLGWSGSNCCLLTPQYGSWVHLGEIICDLELQPDTALQKDCGDCRNCLEACPTGALLEPGVLDPYRCLSYWTQAGGYIPPEIRPALSNRIYGCDTCQSVCPVNIKAAQRGLQVGLKKNYCNASLIEAEPLLLPILNLSNKGFRNVFGETSVAWRGRKTIQRNALVALGNSRDEQAAAVLIRFLTDPRPEIRGHAAWSLGRLRNKKARIELNKAYHKESDPIVKKEIEKALEVEYNS